MWDGVSKSGSPISRWMISRPCASSALAFARTEKAVSVPRRSMRFANSTLLELLQPGWIHRSHYITHPDALSATQGRVGTRQNMMRHEKDGPPKEPAFMKLARFLLTTEQSCGPEDHRPQAAHQHRVPAAKHHPCWAASHPQQQ